jgi:CheY-like chemotaxis protein
VDLSLARLGAMACIAVRDTGRGIDRHLLPHIFEHFRQGEDAQAARGLGLGLAIARHIVELHSGKIRAESEGPGRGATFTVELPLLSEAAPAAGSALALRKPGTEVPPAFASLAGLRVLVVDDDEDTRGLLTTILHHADADVVAAATVREALDALERWKPTVLLSDIGLPDGGGYALIRRVRELEQERGGSLTALAVTAYAGAEDRRQALAAGFQAHLAKPIDPVDLTERIAALVRQARS